jgi:hypothetical protein
MAILANIHAPPLASTAAIYTTKINNDDNNNTSTPNDIHVNGTCKVSFYSALVSLAEKRSRLIQQMEQVIQAIRTLSSIQLGLGPFSPSVNRIENKSVAQGMTSLTVFMLP